MNRKYLLYFIFTIVGIVFIGRLYQLQIIRGADYNHIQNAAVKVVYDYPERGHIKDRNGKLLVANQLSYDIMILPKEVKELDTLELCSILKITKKDFIRRYKKAVNYAPYLSSVFLKQLAKEDFAYLQEKLRKFKGFSIQKRIIRDYPINSAANVLGYISEVNDYIAKNNPDYEQGELIGRAGVEKQYEKVLRGTKGKKFYHRNRLNRIIGSYKDGIYDTVPKNGKDIKLTIDSNLQKYGEYLMKGKRGGIVAIEPSSGEILALISAPTYDPNLMVGRKRSKNFGILYKDSIHKPLFDRGLQATYSPGSPFKLVNALIGLQEGVIDDKTPFYCYHGYYYGRYQNNFMGCHCGIVGQPVRLYTAIARSCNSYFANTYKNIIDKTGDHSEGITTWSKHLNSFGLGNFLGYDLPVGRKGLIPDDDYYNRWYNNNWSSSYTISNAIGQGEVLTTPIQLANVVAAIANRGFFYTPHIVKEIGGVNIKDPQFTIAKTTTIDKQHFEPVIEGMHRVFKWGTASYVNIKGIDIVGKTGTVENFTRIEGKKIQLKDHSILVAFAPKDNPKIAMAVFIENGGFGSTIAAPITSLMIEKYLKGKIERQYLEDRMIATDLYPIYNQEAETLLKKNEAREN